MIINNRKIGANTKPYIIAEISANHKGSIQNVFKLIDECKRIAVDAVKIQTYTPDTITIKSDRKEFQISDGIWSGRSLYDLYSEAYTPFEWHEEIFNYASNVGITLFSSPFDKTAVDLLESLGTPAYKIASFEIIDIPLLEAVAATGKPIIISTGMATQNEIKEALNCVTQNGSGDVALLRTVSGYPAPPEEYNLETIKNMRDTFSVEVGLSDHTLSNTTAIASVALGATIIEKHITLDRNGGGPDDKFSLNPKEFEQLCVQAKDAWKARGNVQYGPKSSESVSLSHRKSLYFVKEMKQGDVITPEHFKCIRPGNGLLPKYYKEIVGKVVKCDIEYGTPTSWDVIDL